MTCPDCAALEARLVARLDALEAAVLGAKPPTIDPDALFDRQEAARLLQCSPDHIRNLWKRGVLPAIDIASPGKRQALRVRGAALLELLAATERRA
jgi:hypothetical protein